MSQKDNFAQIRWKRLIYKEDISMILSHLHSLVWFLFYGPSTHFRSFRARSVTLTALFLGKPPRQFTRTYCTFFRQ